VKGNRTKDLMEEWRQEEKRKIKEELKQRKGEWT
jgi:hypothetical protein